MQRLESGAAQPPDPSSTTGWIDTALPHFVPAVPKGQRTRVFWYRGRFDGPTHADGDSS